MTVELTTYGHPNIEDIDTFKYEIKTYLFEKFVVNRM